jgi:23S rRNA (adenine2503-C2)-methyltransferase
LTAPRAAGTLYRFFTRRDAQLSEQLSEKTDLKNLTLPELRGFLAPLDKAAYRAAQLVKWIYARGATDFDGMTDLSKRFRERLAEVAYVSTLEPSVTQVSEDGTVKFAFPVPGGTIESVIIPDEGRLTLCLSTQVGCALACAFCYTGSLGLTRHLTTAEIMNQICAANAWLAAHGRPALTNLVYMGMGEPLHNVDNTIRSIRIATLNDGLQFSHRKITVSTSGLLPEMERLMRETQVHLAVSLHATTDPTRTRLMPINRRYPLADLLATCRRLPLHHRQRITFEYTLIDGVNDSEADAHRLAGLLRGIPSKINLIAMNEHPAAPFKAPPYERIRRFQDVLQAAGYTAFLRTRRGDDIAAACGQLGERAPAEAAVDSPLREARA